jgi:hypothetical protein
MRDIWTVTTSSAATALVSHEICASGLSASSAFRLAEEGGSPDQTCAWPIHALPIQVKMLLLLLLLLGQPSQLAHR